MTIAHFSAVTGVGRLLPGFTSDPYTVSDVSAGSNTTAGIEIDTDGGIEAFKQAGNQGDIGRWDGSTPGALTMSDFDFFLETTSTQGSGIDAISSDDVDTWVAGGSLISWQVSETSPILSQFVGVLKVRFTGEVAILDTANVTLTADSST